MRVGVWLLKLVFHPPHRSGSLVWELLPLLWEALLLVSVPLQP